MKMEVTKYGDPVLRRKGKLVEEITPEIKALVENMLETMVAAEGVGLAAQQVGEEWQICVIDVRPSERPSWMEIQGKRVDPAQYMPMALINPVLTFEEEIEIGPEGCLSFPNIFADIKRPAVIGVKALDLTGQEINFRCAGLLARGIQHEYDHLQGILFIDRMGFIDRENNEKSLHELRSLTKERLKRKKFRKQSLVK
ncbi:MAG: peptide deformylase [Limisphaerales bacterium]|jgi:peptide deformylase|nr:peptide deformylase [Verrucomicrobiota bacterium]